MNWGFVGFGRIARKFLESLATVEGETAYAFASKSNAEKLAKEFPEIKVYDSYEKLLADSNIDAVYISTTHNFHCENALDALKAGKHVLCEKPLATSVDEVQQMISASKKTGKFLMEAMWMRYLPAYREVVTKVNAGLIGEVKYITANFGFYSQDKMTEEGRLLNPKLAGGALLDVGVYPLALMANFFGWKPQSIQATADKTEKGVDLSIQIQLNFESGQMAQLFGSIALPTSKEAYIYGTKGYFRMPLFWRATSYEWVKDEQKEVFEVPYQSNGFAHEIMAFVDYVRKGKTEPEHFTHRDSLESAQLVERVFQSLDKG